MKNLIVYYSYTGNTEEMVKSILDVISADVLRLHLKEEEVYTGFRRFIWGRRMVYFKKMPELESYEIDLSGYDNIIIGTPCWCRRYSPAIRTFLFENEIRDKNIFLLVCSGGNAGKTFARFEKALEGNNIVSELNPVAPIKNGIEGARLIAQDWIVRAFEKI